MKGKPKKGFSHGLASGKSSLNAPSGNASKLKPKVCTIKDFKEPTPTKPNVVEDDETELNSGFGDYLRSPEAVEMMKLFVVANTVVMIITMAWPSMKEIYKMIEEWWFYENL